MWEFFLTRLAGCLLESCSQEWKTIARIILFFISMGSLLSRVKPLKQSPCLQKYPNLVVFMGNHCSPALWIPPRQVLMLFVTQAEVLWDDWIRTACQARCRWAHSATSPSCMARGKGSQGPISPPCRDTHYVEALCSRPLSQEGEWGLCHENCIEVKEGWRLGFSQDVPEGLGHFPLLRISIPGTTTAVNHDGKASKCAKDEAHQKTAKSPQEDAVLSGSSMVRISAITIAMWEAKELHSWEINICSLQTNKKINESTKLEYIRRSEVSAVGLRWIRRQTTWTRFLEEGLSSEWPGRGCFPALCLDFSSCEMGPVVVIWCKIYCWKILYKIFIILFYYFHYYYFLPPKHTLWYFFQISLAIKKTSCSLIVGLCESSSWQLFSRMIQSTGVFLRNVVFLLINFLLKYSSRQQCYVFPYIIILQPEWPLIS